MASEWEMAMGVDLGMGMATYQYHHNASTAPMMSSSHHGGGSYDDSTAHHHHYYYGMPPPMGDAMCVDDLSIGATAAHEFFPTTAATDKQGHHHYSGAMGMVGEPSPTAANSSDHQASSLLSFADEFYIPSEEAAELEWLSKFVDDSYSDMPSYSSAAHAAAMAAANNAAASNNGGGGGGTSAGQQDSCVTAAAAAPGRGARGKRSSRATAASAAAWHSLAPRPPPSPSSCSSSADFPSSSNSKPAARPSGGGSRGKMKSPSPAAAGGGEEVGVEGGVRRCTHCASDRTPQWRTGPLGPKTLCNACGVRFKSGRLMPEYRPAASPTFVLTQHSNSHRKVVELRRQKELVRIRGSSHRDAAAAAAAAAGSAGGPRPELMFHDYGVC